MKKLTAKEIVETLMSDEFKTLIDSGDIYAVCLKDGTVSLQTKDSTLTGYIKVEVR